MANVIKEKGVWTFSGVTSVNNFFRNSDSPRLYAYECIYWHDGFKFLIGRFPDQKNLSMVEVSTGATAVFAHENSTTVKKVLQIFNERLIGCGLSIAEVVDRFNKVNDNFELWKISTLII